MSLSSHWEERAHEWAAWARTPGHDSYWYVRDRFFDHVVPRPGRATLELGCGEGRVSRDLRDRGHGVTGVDASPTLVELAREADPSSEYVVGDATALPFADASFDLVVAYNVLMNFDDLNGAVREAARVLTPEGRLAACVVHPLAFFFPRNADRRFVAKRSYFHRRDEYGTYERDGLTMTFVDRVRTLEDHVAAFARAGFRIERLREVSDDEPPVRPQFMFLRLLH